MHIGKEDYSVHLSGLDETDRRILEVLSVNQDFGARRISKILGIKPQAVQKKLLSLRRFGFL